MDHADRREGYRSAGMDDTVSQEEIDILIERELPSMHGWCTCEKGKRMSELARGANLCVELGVFGGRSLISMAFALKDQGFGRAEGIDPYVAQASLEGTNDKANADWWESLDYGAIEASARDAVKRLGLEKHVEIIRSFSREAVGLYEDKSIDVLHQDSNHSEEVSCEEVGLWSSKMRSGALWVFDDADWPTTQKAQRELEAIGFLKIEDHKHWKVYRAP